MIRVTGKDLLCAVQLLEQHAAHQQVRPRHRSEREHRGGALDHGGPEPVGAADRKGGTTGAGITPVSQAFGEFEAAPGRAALVECNQPGPARQRGKDQFGLARFQFGGRQRTFFLDLDDRWRRRQATGVERL